MAYYNQLNHDAIDGAVRLWQDGVITWSSERQDHPQGGREQRRESRRKSQWRAVAPGALDEPPPPAGERGIGGGAWKATTGSDGEEEIVWSGRDAVPDASSLTLGMEALSLHENHRGRNTPKTNMSPHKGSGGPVRRGAPPYGMPSAQEQACMVMGAAPSLYKEIRDGFDPAARHHHEYRVPPPPVAPPPKLGDPFFAAVGPPSYEYSSCQSAVGCELLGVIGPDLRWEYYRGSTGQSDGVPLGGRQGGAARRGGLGRKSNACRNGRSGRGRGSANQGKRGGGGFEAGASPMLRESESSLQEPRVPGGQRDRLWKASREADGDIFVSQPFSPHHDRPQTVSIGATEGASIAVVNNGTERVSLAAVKMLYSSPKGSFSLALAPSSRAPSSAEKGVPSPATAVDTSKSVLKAQNGILPGAPWAIGPGLHLTFKLACMAAAMGLHKAVILFDFGTQKIVRYITLICEDEVAKSLAPTVPYVRLPRPRVRSFYKFVPGVPPPLPLFKKRLEFFPIPADVKEAVLNKETLPVFARGLRKENYCEYFAALQFAEELQMEVDIRAYDMQNVTMWRVGHALLGLKVPGLAERRPSVIYRDKIYVRPSGTESREFQGYVHKVQADEVYLRFSDAFHESFIVNSRSDVRFSFGRVNIRRAHQGIHAARAFMDSFLFPTAPVQSTWTEPAKKLVPFNRAVNAEQMSAVSEILRRQGAPPYLIYGPPGTGKTVTVVEAILQVRKAHPHARVLACAPSNSASDLLLERLIGAVEKRDMLRLNAYTRSAEEVPPHVLPFCHLDGGFFCTPEDDALSRYKVVVTTYWSAALLDAQGIGPGHFTHIFLDEAGQGTEPEAMVPIGNLAGADTIVVLAGDHQQLGPLIRSPVALQFGLDKSYLERLSSLPAYAAAAGTAGGYDHRLVTKLVRNYRSHPAILDLPSRLFYGGELVACADESRSSLAEWDGLPRPGFPVVFVGIEGRDEREGSSPSWFNAQEASKVVELVAKVRDYRRSRVSLRDVGVISPYNQQVSKIKKALAAQGLGDVKVGSVESFQGQEKRVVIISTVRSSKEYVEFDKQHRLGFLTNPKRFNVAITRAKALLIVVGNPHVLSQDRCWNELLRYCRENNSYVGCAPPSDETLAEGKELRAQITDDWSDAVDEGTGPSVRAAVEDPQWPDGTC